MERLKKILFYAIAHAMKIGTLLAIVLFLFIYSPFKEVESFGDGLMKFGIFAGVIALGKFLLGGWSAYSVKGMTWSCILSTIAGVALAILGMRAGGTGISFWISILPIGIGLAGGIPAYNWIEDILTDDHIGSLSLDSVAESVFDNGLSSTWNSFMDTITGNMYVSAGRGVAVYSNLVFLTGTVIFIIYS